MSARAKLRSAQLAELAALRAMQQTKAELATAEAQKRAAEAHAEQRRAGEILAADEVEWSRHLNAPTFDYVLASGWAERMKASAETFIRAEKAASDAKTAHEAAQRACAEAIVAAETAQDVAGAARKDDVRHRDEMRLHAMEERAAQNWRRL